MIRKISKGSGPRLNPQTPAQDTIPEWVVNAHHGEHGRRLRDEAELNKSPCTPAPKRAKTGRGMLESPATYQTTSKLPPPLDLSRRLPQFRTESQRQALAPALQARIDDTTAALSYKMGAQMPHFDGVTTGEEMIEEARRVQQVYQGDRAYIADSKIEFRGGLGSSQSRVMIWLNYNEQHKCPGVVPELSTILKRLQTGRSDPEPVDLPAIQFVENEQAELHARDYDDVIDWELAEWHRDIE